MDGQRLSSGLKAFFLYSKGRSASQPTLDTVAVLSLYVAAIAFVLSSITNIEVAMDAGLPVTVAFLSSYAVLAPAAVIVFWVTRRLALAKLVMSACVLTLLAQQIVDVGGAYGLGVLYVMLGFPAIYLLLGFKASAAFIVAYDAAISARLLTGSFSPPSILSYPHIPGRVTVILTISTAVGLLICVCLEFLMRHYVRLAYFDGATGLPNRHRIASSLRNELSYYGQKSPRLAVIAVKMLNLGKANAAIGSELADVLLAQIGRRLEDAAGKRGSVGRWSSSIFIDLVRIGDQGALEAYARDLLERLSRPYAIDGRVISAFFTAAISRFPEDAGTPEQLVANAISLIAHGNRQPGDIRFFDETTLAVQRRNYALIEKLDAADYDRDFRLVYQPVMSLPSARCVGAEILLRWKGPDGADVPPGVFIPLAEQSGAIRKITRWVIGCCVADLSGAGLCQSPGLSFSINLSALDVRDAEFPLFVARTLEEASCRDLRLDFEITETVMLDEDPRTGATIERLLADGFRLSIDDFGTGYSSLSYLHRIKAHRLKVDQSFVRPLAGGTAGEESPLIDAIVSMGKALGLVIVAEGVEKAEQAEYLAARGCDMAQGFLYSPGLPFPSFLDFLKENRV